MTFRELLKMHSNESDLEYIAYKFDCYLHGGEKVAIVNPAVIDSIHNLFQELLAMETTPTNFTIRLERCLDDLETDFVEYMYDLYVIEGQDPNHYAMDLIDWKKLIDAQIDEASILKYGTERTLIEILWEITFDGFDYKTSSTNQKKLIETIKERT